MNKELRTFALFYYYLFLYFSTAYFQKKISFKLHLLKLKKVKQKNHHMTNIKHFLNLSTPFEVRILSLKF